MWRHRGGDGASAVSQASTLLQSSAVQTPRRSMQETCLAVKTQKSTFTPDLVGAEQAGRVGQPPLYNILRRPSVWREQWTRGWSGARRSPDRSASCEYHQLAHFHSHQIYGYPGNNMNIARQVVLIGILVLFAIENRNKMNSCLIMLCHLCWL